MSKYDFEWEEFDDEYLYPMAIEKEFTGLKFLSDVRTTKQHQDKDEASQKSIKRTNVDWSTIKEVEGVFLTHDAIEF